MDGMAEPEPTLSSAVAQALAPTVRSSDSGLLGEFRIENLTCPSKPDTVRPTQLTSAGRGCSHQRGHPNQEFNISSAGASRTRALTTGSPFLQVKSATSQQSSAYCSGLRHFAQYFIFGDLA